MKAAGYFDQPAEPKKKAELTPEEQAILAPDEAQTIPLGRSRQHHRAGGEALHPEREPLDTLGGGRRSNRRSRRQ